MTPLTICIPSLYERAPMLAALLQSLAAQPRANEVEILVAIDGRAPDGTWATTGAKRNQLVASARGRYVVHVDDDDAVSPTYIPEILAAIDRAPTVDAILIRGECIKDGDKAFEFSFNVTGKWDGWSLVDGTSWKSANHLCPVRADIAKALPFPNKRVNEDVEWEIELAPRLHTSERAGGGVLYTYRTVAGREWQRVL